MIFPNNQGSYWYDGTKKCWRGVFKRGAGAKNVFEAKHFRGQTEEMLINRAMTWADSEEGRIFFAKQAENPNSTATRAAATRKVEIPELLKILEKTCKAHGYEFKAVVQALISLGIMKE
jgi:hypothetical protein